jgi:hypothetical protein
MWEDRGMLTGNQPDYVHVRDEAKKKAVAALSGTGLYRPLAAEATPTRSNDPLATLDTNLDTRDTKCSADHLQAIEKFGRGERI